MKLSDIDRAAVSVIARDLTGVAGAALVAIGAGMIWLPIGVIVGGLFLFVAAVMLAMRGTE